MAEFVHQRHKPPVTLRQPRQLIVACPALRSSVNLSRIVRAASCCGVRRLIVAGQAKIDGRIARDGANQIDIETHRSLAPVLNKLRQEDYHLVGLEQTTNARSIYDFEFPRRTVLVIGHERHGLAADVLALLDDVVEIPVYGLPYSHNVATAAAIALYEFCRQFPEG